MRSLDQSKFLANFDAAPEDLTVSEDAFREAFEGYQDMVEARRVFDVFIKIMNAKTSEDLKGISLEDVVSCFAYQAEMTAYLFKKECAGDYFSHMQKVFPSVKNVRKRRAL